MTPAVENILYQTVDPDEEGWLPIVCYNQSFKYRVFFRNRTDLANNLFMLTLEPLLTEFVGKERVDWILEDADYPIGQNPGQYTDDDDRLWGPSVYLTDLSWFITVKLTDDDDDEIKIKNIIEWITVIQTRS